MAGASTPELVAAVSNAGGLGSYGGATTPPGFEAGGHRGTFATPYEQGTIGTVSLIP